MINRKFLSLLKTSITSRSLSIFLLAAVFSVNAEQISDAQEFANKVSALMNYQADFQQSVIDEAGQLVEQTAGEFVIQRPNHFRWQTKSDYQQLIVADGSNMFTYDIDLEQVTIQTQSDVLAESPLLLITSNAAQIEQSFNVRKTDDLKHKRILFQLTPKQSDGVFNSINLLFEENKIIELLMLDSLGQQITVKFSNITINNKQLQQKLFSFQIPKEVEIIDSREKSALE